MPALDSDQLLSLSRLDLFENSIILLQQSVNSTVWVIPLDYFLFLWVFSLTFHRNRINFTIRQNIELHVHTILSESGNKF